MAAWCGWMESVCHKLAAQAEKQAATRQMTQKLKIRQ